MKLKDLIGLRDHLMQCKRLWKQTIEHSPIECSTKLDDYYIQLITDEIMKRANSSEE